ncbi:hypothetical protein CEXT_480831, partial [Caerostris extrusa]
MEPNGSFIRSLEGRFSPKMREAVGAG